MQKRTVVGLATMVDIELSLITRTWLVFWRVCLRALLGKESRDRMLTQNPKINSVTRGWYPYLCSDGVLILPVDSHPVLLEIYRDDVYGYRRIEKNDVVVDVGAHVGVFTLKAARKARLVIAVEPYPLNFKLLLINVRINGLANVIPINSALGSYNGEAELHIDLKSDDHTISEKGRRDHQETIPYVKPKLKVKLETLDYLIHELGIDKVSFIKIDAEGTELDILKGASNTLNKKGVRVSVASYHYPEETTIIKGTLSACGFKMIEPSKGILHGSKTDD